MRFHNITKWVRTYSLRWHGHRTMHDAYEKWSYPICQLKIIPIIDANKLRPRWKFLQNKSLHHSIRPKKFKKVSKGPNYRLVGKNFKRNFINSKKFIFSPYHLFLTIHSAFGATSDHEIQSLIPGSRNNGITNRQVQVDPHLIPYLFNAFISNFHCVLFCLELPKVDILAHVSHMISSHI